MKKRNLLKFNPVDTTEEKLPDLEEGTALTVPKMSCALNNKKGESGRFDDPSMPEEVDESRVGEELGIKWVDMAVSDIESSEDGSVLLEEPDDEDEEDDTTDDDDECDTDNDESCSEESEEFDDSVMCRTCGGPGEISIYGDDGIYMKLEEKINDYLPITVSKDDNLPLMICSLCVQRLNSCHELMWSSIETDERLRRLLEEKTMTKFHLKQDKEVDVLGSSGENEEIENAVPDTGVEEFVFEEMHDTDDKRTEEIEAETLLDTVETGIEEVVFEEMHDTDDMITEEIEVETLLDTVDADIEEVVFEEMPDPDDETTIELTPETLLETVETEIEVDYEEVHDTADERAKRRLSETSFDTVDDDDDEEGVDYEEMHDTDNEKVEPTKSETLLGAVAPSTNSPIVSLKTKEQNKATNSKKRFDTLRPYSCDICSKRFKIEKFLKKHIHSKHSNDHYVCFKCNNMSDSKLNFIDHFKSNHFKDGQYACQICSKKFCTMDEVLSHEGCDDVIQRAKVAYQCLAIEKYTAEDMAENLRKYFNNGHYVCEICEKKLASTDDAVEHYSECNSSIKYIQESYRCYHCNKEFSSRTKLLWHLGAHFKADYFTCPLCERMFDSGLKVLDHHDCHGLYRFGDSLLRCIKCNSGFRSMEDLITHLGTHFVNNTYTCKLCEHVYNNPDDLTEHYSCDNLHKFHTERFSCLKCSHLFDSKEEALVHLETHFTSGSFTCVCEKTFSDPNEVVTHYKDHNKKFYESIWECPKCERVFAYHYKFISHLMNHAHRWTCELCGKVLSSEQALQTHCESKHTDDFYICQYCSKVCSSLFSLQKHERSHENSESEDLTCLDCGKKFRTKPALRQHAVVHSAVRPYGCDMCNKAFYRKALLKQHLQVHSPLRQFACAFCNKAFRRQSNLILHIRTHTGERPYKCPLCERAFAQKGDMKKHTKTHLKNPETKKRNGAREVKVEEETKEIDLNDEERVTIVYNDPDMLEGIWEVV